MMGGAVGDALGWPVEFKSERQIFNRKAGSPRKRWAYPSIAR